MLPVEHREWLGGLLDFYDRRVDELAIDICHKTDCLHLPTQGSSR
jgi:hypothetical protein